jgi:UDP-glucose 4-epimerase
MIDNKESGLFFPQNKEYVKTSEMVRLIADVHGKKIRLMKVFNPFIKLMYRIGTVNKVFGNMVYDKSMSEYDKGNYQLKDLRESILRTEGRH